MLCMLTVNTHETIFTTDKTAVLKISISGIRRTQPTDVQSSRNVAQSSTLRPFEIEVGLFLQECHVENFFNQILKLKHCFGLFFV